MSAQMTDERLHNVRITAQRDTGSTLLSIRDHGQDVLDLLSEVHHLRAALAEAERDLANHQMGGCDV